MHFMYQKDTAIWSRTYHQRRKLQPLHACSSWWQTFSSRSLKTIKGIIARFSGVRRIILPVSGIALNVFVLFHVLPQETVHHRPLLPSFFDNPGTHIYISTAGSSDSTLPNRFTSRRYPGLSSCFVFMSNVHVSYDMEWQLWSIDMRDKDKIQWFISQTHIFVFYQL